MAETTTRTATTDATPVDPVLPTNPSALAPSPDRPGLSVRIRITLAVSVLVALALGSAGWIVYLIEAQRIEEQVVSEIDQELGEFAALQLSGRDPATGERFRAVPPLLDTFLQRNVPDGNEVLVSWYDGGPQKAFSGGEDVSFLTSGPFLAAVEPMIGRNTSRRLEIAGYGEAFVTVQSVRSSRETGALIVVTYLEGGKSELVDTMRTYALVSAIALLLVTAVAAWQSGRLLAPLRTLRETAEEIGETDLSRRLPVAGNDDITALTRTVNGMLDRLEMAFVGQRQFLDDAGHELRTPLTVLRGHLELLDTSNPEDVDETRELLLDEVDRMSRLVGDLILLAKSDRPDFATFRPVDLAGLTEDLLSKARGLGERVWRLDAAAEAAVVVDEQRITQAVLQLADNAVKHTGPGDEVAIGSSVGEDGVRIWVRDTGPGVPEADRRLIFERFGRSVVPVHDEGFGLGLSIVSAIAAAHGGRVDVEDADPPGALFVITLPTQPRTDGVDPTDDPHP